MFLKSFLMFLLGQLLAGHLAYSAQCHFDLNAALKENSEAAVFLKNSLFATHLQLTHENFNSMNAIQSRTKIFDMIVNTPYWSQKFSKPAEFKIFWNWVRFQYWGLLQQQALLKEDQGFKISQDKSLNENFQSILKLPIYPHPISAKSYVCSANERSIYPCEKNIVKADVLISPALACDKSIDMEALKFTYYLTKENSGWVILDIQFKGRNLILDSFTEHDNFVNKYGNDKAIGFLKFFINKVAQIDPQTNPMLSGSNVFDRDIKMKAPAYPISY